MAKEEKKKLTMAELAKKLNKEYNDNNLIIKADIIPSYTRLSTGMLGMDYALFGGLTDGRLHVFAGPEHSGKTTGSCVAIAAYQKQHPDKTCVYIDCEHSLDLNFQALMCAQLGFKLNDLYYYSPNGQSGEQILADILDMEDTEDIGMIVLDSIPALVPQATKENEFEKDMGQRGTIAKSLHKFCPEMCGKLAKVGNQMIMVNQVREAGKTFTGATIYTEPGGAAPRYYASTKIRFGTRSFIKDGEEIKGADGEGATGFRLKFKITKNKTAASSRGGGFMTFNYETGADIVNDLLDVALKFDFIKRINNVTYELVDLRTGEVIVTESGETMRNRKTYLMNYLANHEDFRNKYIAMLKHFISASNDRSLLDKDDQAEIEAAEKSVNSQQQTKEEYEAEQAQIKKNRQLLMEAGVDPDSFNAEDTAEIPATTVVPETGEVLGGSKETPVFPKVD